MKFIEKRKYRFNDDNNLWPLSLKLYTFTQAISCLKKAIWLEPTNFNCLFNLGLIYLTAQQYASAFHTLAAAACIRLDNPECYMLLGSKCVYMKQEIADTLSPPPSKKITWSKKTTVFRDNKFHTVCAHLSIGKNRFSFFSSHVFSLNTSYLVCLRNLRDHGNAFLAFERSVMLPDAVKYPLIYLNFAIYCVQMKRYEMAGMYLENFFSVSEHTSVRHEVSVSHAAIIVFVISLLFRSVYWLKMFDSVLFCSFPCSWRQLLRKCVISCHSQESQMIKL